MDRERYFPVARTALPAPSAPFANPFPSAIPALPSGSEALRQWGRGGLPYSGFGIRARRGRWGWCSVVGPLGPILQI